MKRVVCLILALLFVSAFALCGCDNGNTQPTDAPKATETAPIETQTVGEPIGEDAAKEIVFADLSIQESAAENLEVKFENNAYIITFQWSGFDYQYTINGTSGEITEILFDGEPL